jgi:hypothetical protein
MEDKASTKGISLNESEWEHADARAKVLKLDPRSARSDYFRLLIDLDRHYVFSKHPHQSDGKWHLYPESPVSQVAEAPASYGGHPPNVLREVLREVVDQDEKEARQAPSRPRVPHR